MHKQIILAITALAASLLGGCTAASNKARAAARADDFFKSGEYDKAKIEYLNVLRVDPRDVTALARLGTMWYDDGAPMRAGAFLVRATELAPSDMANHLKLGQVYLAIGRTANARKEAMTALGGMPDNGEALLLLAQASSQPDELAASQKELEKFANKNSVYYLLASATLAGKKSDMAGVESALQRALAADPKLPTVHSALSTYYSSKKDAARSASELEEAANLSPPRSMEKLRFAQLKLQTAGLDDAKAYLKTITDKAPDYLPVWSALARIANRQQKYDEALQLIQNVLTRDPDNIDARVVQAESWTAKHEARKAVDSLETLNRNYVDVPVIKYALARSYLENNNLNQAMEQADQAVRLSPGFVDAVILQAQLHLRNNDAKSVIPSLSAIVRASPGLIPAEMLLAEAYRVDGRLDDAVTLLQEQIKRTPQNAAPYFLLGSVLRQQNKIDDARRALEKAAEIAPENPSSTEQLVELDIVNKAFAQGHERVKKLLEKHPDSGAAYFLEAKLDIAEGKYDLAEAALLKAIDLNPNLPGVFELLIPTYNQTHKLTDALNEMNAVLAKNPNDVRALLVAALIYDTTNDSNKAREYYERLLAVDPNSVPALNNLALMYANKLNDLNRAVELAQKARSLTPASASVTDTLGWIFYKQGNYQQAADLLAESAAKEPNNAEMQFHLGMADYMMGRTDAARSALERAVAAKADFAGKDEARTRLQLLGNNKDEAITSAQLEQILQRQPNDPVALMRLGEAYEKEGASPKASDAYERALKANPKLFAASVKLAQLNAGPLNNPAKALDYAKKARELAPADPQVAVTLGGIAYQTGNFQWAYSLLQDATRQLPDDPEALSRFAWAAYSLGRVGEAQQTMQHIVDSAPNSLQASGARTFLAAVAWDAEDTDPSAHEGEIKELLAKDPKYVPALVAQASITQRRGDAKGAADIYTAVLQRFPDFAVAEKRLASIYAESPENVGKALELANKARKNLPDDVELSRILARISYKQKEYARAIQLLHESERRKPLDPTSAFVLAMSQAQTGHKGEARQGLHHALDSGLAEPEATEARRALSELDRPGQ